jgi:putative PIN family toxin of toxin-antitoxin system
MIRVVADTNVYVSALLFGGAPEEVLLLARTGSISLHSSAAIQEELNRVLAAKFGWKSSRVRAAQAALSKFTVAEIPKAVVKAVAEDDSDNRVLECALAARAHVIVSGDRHLRKLRNFQGIPILSPREFLAGLPEFGD